MWLGQEGLASVSELSSTLGTAIERDQPTDLEPSICETLHSERAPSTRIVYEFVGLCFLHGASTGE